MPEALVVEKRKKCTKKKAPQSTTVVRGYVCACFNPIYSWHRSTPFGVEWVHEPGSQCVGRLAPHAKEAGGRVYKLPGVREALCS